MANIILTNTCNLKCQYCFAESITQEKPYFISEEELKKILTFISKTEEEQRIGILGGEPTLHPDFGKIMQKMIDFGYLHNASLLVFTNGIELKKWLPWLADLRVHILINCNSPLEMNQEQLQKYYSSLEAISKQMWFNTKVTCGCNLHLNCNDYSYIWEIVDKYNLISLRTSVTSPGGCYLNWKNNKEGYYNQLKPIFLQFCEDAKKHNCILTLDCNQIPLCYFSSGEKQLIFEVCQDIKKINYCEPVIDIAPNFTATSCFGSYDPVDLTNFSNLDEIKNYFLFSKNFPKVQNNNFGKCANCKNFQLNKCQGGCLAFAKEE